MAKVTRKSNEPTEIIKLLLLNYMLLGGASSGDIKNSHLWKMPHLDGVHFRCGKLLLLHPWTDLDETFRMYRVDLEIMHREIFDFRFRPQTGSWLFFANRKLKRSEPEVETYLIGKLASFCNESPIFVFWTFNPGNRYNHFCPGISIYYYIGDKIFQKPLAPPLFKISKK